MFDDYTRLSEGQSCPVSAIGTLSGGVVRLTGPGTGKPFMIHFFIARCPRCRKSMEYIEKKILKTAGEKMQIIGVGRDHSAEELIELQRDKGWSLCLAADPDRTIYDLFAEKKVPRTYLFNADGKLVRQVRGYNEEEYGVLHEMIGGLPGDADPGST